MIIEGWQVNNFLTLFILVMILAFQSRGSRVKTSRMFTYIIITTIVLVVADTFARIGENRGGSYILMAFFGNLIMFLVDPLIILFSVIYIYIIRAIYTIIKEIIQNLFYIIIIIIYSKEIYSI